MARVKGRGEAVGTAEAESEPPDHTTDGPLSAEVVEIDRVAEEGCPENRGRDWIEAGSEKGGVAW